LTTKLFLAHFIKKNIYIFFKKLAKIGKYIFLAQNFKKLLLLDFWGKNVNFKPIPAFVGLF